MSSQKPVLIVLGATGNQGGSIVSHFLSMSPSPYTLRGVTRDPSSSRAIDLASKGVEMVAGDFDDPASLKSAFEGAAAIFSVTDYWQYFHDPKQRELASEAGQNIGVFVREYETKQNQNIIDAAAQVSTLERFIFSALPSPNKLSKGKYSHVYHFDGKGVAEEYGRSVHPELWAKTSVFYAGFFLENYFEPLAGIFQPKSAQGALVLSLPEAFATMPLPMYSVVDDTGSLVAALLRASPGKKMIGVKEWLSAKEFAQILAQVLQKNLEHIDCEISIDLGDPDLEKDYSDMIGFCIECGFDGGKVDQTVVQPTDLGVLVQLNSVKEWCEKQDWTKLY